jgi:hypothetical protein
MVHLLNACPCPIRSCFNRTCVFASKLPMFRVPQSLRPNGHWTDVSPLVVPQRCPISNPSRSTPIVHYASAPGKGHAFALQHVMSAPALPNSRFQIPVPSSKTQHPTSFSPHEHPDPLQRKSHSPTGSYFSMLSGRLVRGRIIVL